MGPNLFGSVSMLGCGSSYVGGRVQFGSLLLRTGQTNTYILGEVYGLFSKKVALLYLILYGIHSLKKVIGQGFDDSYLGLDITYSQPF